MSTPAPAWLNNVVLDGLQRLVALQLPGAPAAEVVPLTATVWIETLHAARAWREETDAKRLQTAFVALAAEVDRWPAPRAVLEHLPRAAEPLCLPGPKHEPSADVVARLARLSRNWAARRPGAQGEEAA